ncbi:MAG: AarF/UbiB family protein, partial [Stenotrophobium sp.]
FQFQVAERLLFTILHHIFVYREIHGDLHPGNVMIGSDGALHLIDWGNVVSLDGKWGAVWDYLAGAVLADTDLLTDALIRVSTQPEANRARRAEIKAYLDETIKKKNVRTLTRRNFVFELRRGGMAALHRRGQAVLHLMSNTQQIGVVLQRDYLHLSRALFAATGSFGSLYEDTPKKYLARDVLLTLARMPLTLTQSQVQRTAASWRLRLSRLPMPEALRKRLKPPQAALPTRPVVQN